MSTAKQRNRWQCGDAADSKEVRQGTPSAASGILIGPLQFLLLKQEGFAQKNYGERRYSCQSMGQFTCRTHGNGVASNNCPLFFHLSIQNQP